MFLQEREQKRKPLLDFLRLLLNFLKTTLHWAQITSTDFRPGWEQESEQNFILLYFEP
jgi:hypothetical protein